MLIVVDPHSGVPVYRQLMDQIKFHIASGLLIPGNELPSTRALSSELGINPMTISKAYSYLERDQVIERRPGRPLIVKAIEKDKVMENKMNQLQEALKPVVTIVKQLDLSVDDVTTIFRKLLETPETASGIRSKELDS